MTETRVDKDTVLCISIAARPGNLGATVHNAGYRALGLNFLYKPCLATDAGQALAGVRGLSIRGCSVSMPFKQEVIPHLDALDSSAEKVGAVNTIVNEGGQLTGYNTDVLSVAWALEHLDIGQESSVLVLGGGGMARAAVAALRRHGVARISVSNRTVENARALSDSVVPWDERHSQGADLLINATPLGMTPNDEEVPILLDRLSTFTALIDVIALPPRSLLAHTAREMGIRTVPGYILSFHQSLAQFRLYTGVAPPEDAMFAALRDALGVSPIDLG